MNCREFQNEFEDRAALSESAILHQNSCSGCKTLSEQQTQIWQLINSLQKVDAPEDFNFRVKAKIAQGKPADFQPRLLPALRFVMPLSVIVLVLSLVAYSVFNFSNDGTNAPQVAENVPQTVIEDSPVNLAPIVNSFTENNTIAESNTAVTLPFEKPIIAPVVNQNPPQRREAQFVAQTNPPRRPATRVRTEREDFSGSRDSSLSASPVFTPKGIDLSPNVRNLPETQNSSAITGDDFLTFIGIETARENNIRKVKSVRQDSNAARAGVKVGDVVEAIDGRKINDVGSGSIEGKKLTVLRGGEKIEIVLQNQLN